MLNQDEFPAYPMVSVILATYNRAHLVSRAIEGVLCQTYANFEFIIVDDGSTDHTATIVGQYSDPRIIYKPVEHGERARARNIGIQTSRGQYISFLDSDDWYLPEKLAQQVAALESHPEAGMALGGWEIVDDTGQKVDEIHPWESIPSQLTMDDWLFHANATPDTVLVRREWFDKVDGFDSEIIISEDIDMWIRLSLAGCKTVWTKKNVAVVLAHSSNSLRSWTAVRNSRMNFLAKSFARPEFSRCLAMSQDEVYASFHLVLSWQAFDSGLIPEGISELEMAVDCFPDLMLCNGRSIADSIVIYSQFFLNRDPLRYAMRVFDHLPSSLIPLKKMRRSTIRDICTSRAWKAKRYGNFREMRKNTLQAVYYDPMCLKNRGVFSMMVQSILGQRFWQLIHQ